MITCMPLGPGRPIIPGGPGSPLSPWRPGGLGGPTSPGRPGSPRGPSMPWNREHVMITDALCTVNNAVSKCVK